MKKLIVAVLIVLLSIAAASAVAETWDIGQIKAEYDESKYKLSFTGNGPMPDITSDTRWQSIKGKVRYIAIDGSISSISAGAFEDCPCLYQVNINSDSVTSIGVNAFKNSRVMHTVVLSKNVSLIDESAFDGCSRLMIVTLPTTLKTVGRNAFNNCEKIREVHYDASYADWNKISMGTGNGDLLRGLLTSDMKIWKFDTVTVTLDMKSKELRVEGEGDMPDVQGCAPLPIINTYDYYDYDYDYDYDDYIHNEYFEAEYWDKKWLAFNTAINTVKVSEGITSIGDFGFYTMFCSEAYLPSTLKLIGKDAFFATSLKTVELPAGLESVGDYAFSRSSLRSINIPNSEIEWGSYVFEQCNFLSSVAFPSGMTTIPDLMFIGCNALKSIVIPEGVVSIGSCSFSSSGLESVTLPASLRTVGNSAFSYCNCLTEAHYQGAHGQWEDITFGANNGDLVSALLVTDDGGIVEWMIGNITVTLDPKAGTLILSGSGALDTEDERWNNLKKFYKSVEIGEGITAIGDNAFYGCTKLKSVKLPSTLKSLGTSAFAECPIERITLPAGLETIPDYAFYRCSLLEELIIPEGVSKIGSSALDECSSLRKVTLPHSLKIIDAYAFSDCIALTDVYYNGTNAEWAQINIGSLNTELGAARRWTTDAQIEDLEWQLENCTATLNMRTGELRISGSDAIPYVRWNEAWQTHPSLVEKITIEEDITEISMYCFEKLYNLTSVSLPSTLESIGQSAFVSCTALKNIELPSGLKTIEAKAFYGTGIETLTLPSGLETVLDNAFAGCRSLKRIILPPNMTDIPQSMLDGCSALETIELPAGLQVIGERALRGCSAIRTLSFHEGLTEIQDEALSNMPSLERIDLPHSIKLIAASALWGDDALTDIYYDGTQQEWEQLIKQRYFVDTDKTTVHFLRETGNTVTYNYQYNGGTACSVDRMSVPLGEPADLTPNATRENWTFVGWNTDPNAHEALTELNVTGNTTLYAIFSKKQTVMLYASGNKLQTCFYPVLYNRDTNAVVTLPEPAAYSGWTALGWTDNPSTANVRYGIGGTASFDADITGIIRLYALYSRKLTVGFDSMGGTSVSKKEVEQVMNVKAGASAVSVTLPAAPTKTGHEFIAWAMGSPEGVQYAPGKVVSLTENTVFFAVWDENHYVEPTLSAVTVSGITKTDATFSVSITKQGSEEITDVKFEYYMLDLAVIYSTDATLSGGKYTATVRNLSPGMQYFVRAVVSDSVQDMRTNYINFATMEDPKPVSVSIDPQNAVMQVGQSKQLFVEVLPANATERGVVWSSSNESVAKVNSEGRVTGYSKGTATITATAKANNKLKATCIVVVNDYLISGSYDFSERHMSASLAQKNTGDPDIDERGYIRPYNSGGNAIRALAYLARWDGAVLESQCPYDVSNPEIVDESKIDTTFHVQEAIFLSDRRSWDDNDEIKNAVRTYGGVVAAFQCADDDAYFNKQMTRDRKYFYNSHTEGAYTKSGHEVLIVGWDDNISRNNFVEKPPYDGAFICKNSWGERSGDQGYLYVSYCDVSFASYCGDNCVITKVESGETNGSMQASNYNKIYDYDPLGHNGFVKTRWACNVFPRGGKGGLVQNEVLRAVSFYTLEKNVSYEIYIIPDYISSSSLLSRGSVNTSGIIKEMGYHTVNLDMPINLKKGSRFAVVISLSQSNGDSCRFALEMPNEGQYASVKAYPDESYYSSSGISWTDLGAMKSPCNVCIKAFTDNGDSSAKLYYGVDNFEEDPNYVGSSMTAVELYEWYYENSDGSMDGINTELLNTMIEAEANGEKADTLNREVEPFIVINNDYSVAYSEGVELPSRFSLKDEGCVTPIRNQGSYGLCWAHAVCASMESSLLRRQQKGVNYGEAMAGSEDTYILDSSDGVMPVRITTDEDVVILHPGDTFSLSLVAYPENAQVTDVIWYSSAPDVVRVDMFGNLTALDIGGAEITVSSNDGSLFAVCEVFVVPAEEAEGILLELHKVYKNPGDVFLLDYLIYPEGAESCAVRWTCDNDRVIAIDEYGCMTALRQGTATVTVTTADGRFSDKAQITVGNGMDCDLSLVGITADERKSVNLYIDLTLSVFVPNDTVTDGMLVIAAYDEADRYISGDVKTISFAKIGDDIILHNIFLKNAAEAERVECYLLRNDRTMMPLSNVLRLR